VFTPDQYQLIDFGRGRKLERFGPHVLDRTCPAAERLKPSLPNRWTEAEARFDRTDEGDGQWSPPDCLPDRWRIRHADWSFEVRPTPFGHVGLFPEQAENWDWLIQQLGAVSTAFRVLNLFAYTGGSTLAAATAGAETVHVDAAKNVVNWARRNAEQSALAGAPIRWICEDAATFVRRELRRGARYDALILDPPSYGRGPKGQVWKIDRHLEPLLDACGQLMQRRARLILLTCHTAGYSSNALRRLLARTCVAGNASQIEARMLTLSSSSGRQLPSGLVARWSRVE
jgi:23S rRNA (cytosine1962-C5)-methyltransferase